MADAPTSKPVNKPKEIIEKLLSCGAVSPETAKTPEEIGSFGDTGYTYFRLEQRGVIKPCGDGRYYIDADGYALDSRRARLAKISLVTTLVGTLLAIVLALTILLAHLSSGLLVVGFIVALLLIIIGAVLRRRRK